MDKFIVKKYESRFLPDMARLFYDTVHTVSRADYTRRQLDAWADGRPDLDRWDRSFSRHDSLLVFDGERLVGFGDMDDTGYLDRLYVHRCYQRQGIATLICRTLENQSGLDSFSVHRSLTARPFFEKMGYKAVKSQQVTRHGIQLTNFIMIKNNN